VETPVGKKRRGMLAFYIGTGVVFALFVGGWIAWTPFRTWYRERQVLRAYMRGLDTRVSFQVVNVSLGSAMSELEGIVNLGPTIENAEGLDWDKNVNLEYSDVRAAVVIEDLCGRAGARWTIAERDDGLARTPTLRLVISSPARIAELEEANPRVTAVVHRYRVGLAEELGLKKPEKQK